MPIDSSDSKHPGRLFGRERPLHTILGDGKVSDILLWKNKKLSAAILIALTIIWFLFEVVEYNFVTFLAHISIILMFTIFIWFNGAGIMNWNPPDIDEIKLPESTFRWLFTKINRLLMTIYEISCGRDLVLFSVAIAFLWVLSVIGSYFSSLNLLYIGFLVMETLPVLYERYENEVDYLASKGNQDVKKLYKKFDSRILDKIPRGPVKERKFK